MTRDAYNRIYLRWYSISVRGKAARKKYAQSDKGKATARRANARYYRKMKQRKERPQPCS